MEQKTDAQKTILIVEDEKNIVDILRFNLQREGYRTVEAYDGADGLEKARKENPDLILLDVMLPKMIGFDVCRTLREEGNNVPVIILTAREEEADKVSGLEIGADDYITKPFSMRELIARVGANIRRTAMNTAAAATAAATAMPVAGDLSIDTDSHQVFRDGKPLELTTREYELLTFLASHPNKVYSRIDLMEQVWNYGYVADDKRLHDDLEKLVIQIGYRVLVIQNVDDEGVVTAEDGDGHIHVVGRDIAFIAYGRGVLSGNRVPGGQKISRLLPGQVGGLSTAGQKAACGAVQHIVVPGAVVDAQHTGIDLHDLLNTLSAVWLSGGAAEVRHKLPAVRAEGTAHLLIKAVDIETGDAGGQERAYHRHQGCDQQQEDRRQLHM